MPIANPSYQNPALIIFLQMQQQQIELQNVQSTLQSVPIQRWNFDKSIDLSSFCLLVQRYLTNNTLLSEPQKIKLFLDNFCEVHAANHLFQIGVTTHSLQ